MRRWFPYPLLTLGLFVMWLLLSQSLAPGQLVLGGMIAMLASRSMAALQPEKPRIRSARAIARLAGIVMADIVRSNIAVARIVLSPARRDRVSAFVRLPLDIRSRHGLTVLACIITATPGTMWVQFDRATNMLLVHVLDLIDEEAWIRLIKRRYESLLVEIFE